MTIAETRRAIVAATTPSAMRRTASLSDLTNIQFLIMVPRGCMGAYHRNTYDSHIYRVPYPRMFENTTQLRTTTNIRQVLSSSSVYWAAYQIDGLKDIIIARKNCIVVGDTLVYAWFSKESRDEVYINKTFLRENQGNILHEFLTKYVIPACYEEYSNITLKVSDVCGYVHGINRRYEWQLTGIYKVMEVLKKRSILDAYVPDHV